MNIKMRRETRGHVETRGERGRELEGAQVQKGEKEEGRIDITRAQTGIFIFSLQFTIGISFIFFIIKSILSI